MKKILELFRFYKPRPPKEASAPSLGDQVIQASQQAQQPAQPVANVPENKPETPEVKSPENTPVS